MLRLSLWLCRWALLVPVVHVAMHVLGLPHPEGFVLP